MAGDRVDAEVQMVMWRKWVLGVVTGAVLTMVAVAATPEEDFATGRQAFDRGDLIGAMQALQRAADAGHAGAQVLYGYILDKSENNVAALRYYSQAAESGNAEGAYYLGIMYGSGHGVARDQAMAVHWLERSVAGGYWPAAVVLARAHLDGALGLEVDRAAGERLLRQAADAGHEPARAALDALSRAANEN